MGTDAVNVISLFDDVEIIFENFQAPYELPVDLMRLYLSERAIVWGQLDSARLRDYKQVVATCVRAGHRM